MTESQLFIILKNRLCRNNGNGPSFVLIPHVKNDAGHKGSRTIDAIGMSLYPSRGLELHGFEIKSTRSDWLRELVQREKSECWKSIVDRFWLVSDLGVARSSEIPTGWGWMEVRGRSLRQRMAAPLIVSTATLDEERAIHLPIGFDRGQLAALLRAATKTTDYSTLGGGGLEETEGAGRRER